MPSTNCTCAKLYYRNNRDGTRDFKVKGSLSCRRCQGYGKVLPCTGCDGCGLVLGKVCPGCYGNGVVPDRMNR